MPLKIGELAKRANCSVKAVRFYEAKGLLTPPARSPSGYRLYTDGHLRCLQLIRRAKLLGLSLAKIRTLVVHLGDDAHPGATLRPRLERLLRQELQEIATKLEQLAVLRDDLERVLARIHGPKGALPRELCVCASPPKQRRS
jgi:MerR family copper efflux transcriptional regulator